MVVDDAQPALVDKLIKTGCAGRGGPGVGIEAALNLRLIEQIVEVDAGLAAGHRNGIGHAIAASRPSNIHFTKRRHINPQMDRRRRKQKAPDLSEAFSAIFVPISRRQISSDEHTSELQSLMSNSYS